MNAPVVALASSSPSMVEQMLRASGTPLEFRRLSGTREDDLVGSVADADALLISGREAVTARVIAALARCRVIARRGVGVDNVDVAAASQAGILVTCVPDGTVDEVSDHAVALLLACARRVVQLDRAVKGARWAHSGAAALAPSRTGMRRLRDLTLGLVGFGRLGQATWRKARAFGLTGLVHDPVVAGEVVRANGAEFVGWDELLARSDFVSIHAPLTPQTRGLFNHDAFARMKPTAFIINTARGAIVDEMALIEAIRAGQLAGAALDVTRTEPLPANSPLLQLDEVILTGHSAYYSEDADMEITRRMVKSVLAALRGNVPEGLVNPEALSVEGEFKRARRRDATDDR